MGTTRRPLLRDVSLRDGLQLEDPLPLAAKLELLDAIVATGVRRIEATAFVSPRAVPALADAEDVASAALSRWPEVEFSALVASPGGAARAVAAGLRRVEYVVSASETHSRANVRRTVTEAVAQTAEVASLVHGAGGRLEVIVAIAFDCPFEGPTPVETVTRIASEVVALGADELCLGDTIGTATPVRTSALVTAVSAAAPSVPLGLHLHDTRGTGLASAWAGWLAGVDRFDGAVGGLGGCPFAPGASGNVAFEELAHLFADGGLLTDLSVPAAISAAALAAEFVGHPLPSRLLKAGLPALAAAGG